MQVHRKFSLDKESKAPVCRPLACEENGNSSGQSPYDFRFPYNGSCLQLGDECDNDKYYAYTMADPFPDCYWNSHGNFTEVSMRPKPFYPRSTTNDYISYFVSKEGCAKYEQRYSHHLKLCASFGGRRGKSVG